MNWLLLVLKYFPLVLQSVVTVENLVGNKDGKTKKDLVLNSVTAVNSITKNIDETHVQVISSLIDSTVKSLNDSGVFVTSKPKA